ncbi:HypA protein [Biscogniauxia marginata]|nr:HypA protein [Biscogniauxia marginata]
MLSSSSRIPLRRMKIGLNSYTFRRNITKMATAHTIQITPDNTGLWHVRQSEPAAKKTSELLQKDLESHHVYFNDSGFHNHISHQLLALYGTGASAEDIEKGYYDNVSYQRPAYKAHENAVEELRDWDTAKKRLGKGQYYADFLAFFQAEIERLGWEKTLHEYMFKGDERSEDMLIRMFAGFVHPLIQLMYGVEWQQPAMVAMGLAQAAIHHDDLRNFMFTAEEAEESASTPMPRITNLLDAVREDKKVATAARLVDPNKIQGGVLARAWDETIKIVGQVKVNPDELEERTVEMYNAQIYEAAAAALRPGKYPKFDFFLMHHVNVNPIFVVINKQEWISTANKVRLLEWKIRLDLVQYAARGCPPLSLDSIASYVPRDKNPGPAIELLPRIHALHEDGHVSKLFRAVGIGHEISKKYEDREWLKIKGDLWTKIAYMVIDGAESPGRTWVRSAGFDGAWKEVPDRPKKENGQL